MLSYAALLTPGGIALKQRLSALPCVAWLAGPQDARAKPFARRAENAAMGVFGAMYTQVCSWPASCCVLVCSPFIRSSLSARVCVLPFAACALRFLLLRPPAPCSLRVGW